MVDNKRLKDIIYESLVSIDSAHHVAVNVVRADNRRELIGAIGSARSAIYAIQVASRNTSLLGTIKTDRAIAAMEFLTSECLKREPVDKQDPEALVITAVLSLCLASKIALDKFIAEYK
ncbi:hypothetical protein Ares1_0100 [Vibrio phage Ares1]|nr:hypothetical protein Ares1_0100 [Vibrio phage Ares1]